MGLFDKFKKNKKVNELEKTDDSKITPNMYDFWPPKTEIYQPNVEQNGPTLEEYKKEVLEQEEKVISETNKTASYIEGAMSQFNNS